MKYIKTLIMAAIVTTMVAANVQAADYTNVIDDGQWAVTLAGSGASTTKGESHSVFATELGIGHTVDILFPAEAGIRQSFGIADDTTVFGTRVYNDWTILKYQKFELAAGGSIGADYGDRPTAWSGAPEVVVKWWLKSDVAAFGRVEYPINLDSSGEDYDQLRYVVGFSVRF